MAKRIAIKNQQDERVWVMEVATRWHDAFEPWEVLSIASEVIDTVGFDGQDDEEMRFITRTSKDAQKLLDAFDTYLWNSK